MDLLWPGFLLLLGIIPLIVVIYIIMLRRRRQTALRYSSLSLVREVLPRPARLRRYLPFILFMLAIASLIVALGRPVTVASVPTDQISIILAIDVSRSMCSTDILPSRLEAAEAAALSFIKQQKASTQIGIVAFSGFAELIQAPTSDPELLVAAVNSLMTGRRTAIGTGILKSIDAIADINKNVAPSTMDPSTASAVNPVPQGAYVPEIIVLLTDGASNRGPNPLDAAQQAADRGVRVYTIGFGTENGSSFPSCPDQYLGNEPFGGGQSGGNQGGGGGGFRRGIDEETLKGVAKITGGEYYPAESADELQKVFSKLPTYLITKHEVIEISVVFAAFGAFFAALAIFLSMLWHPLP